MSTTETRPVLRHLGEWLAEGAGSAELPPAAVVTARRSILDLIGVAVAAAGSPLVAAVDRLLAAQAAPGPATVFGHRTGRTAELAALANGAIGHALDFDDVSHPIGGHPTVAILPAVLALAETRRATGAQVLRAYATGVEIQTAIARSVNFAHYDKGWHPTATLGTIGAAAGAARLLGLDADRATAALSLATSFAGGIKAGFGTMAKPLQVGHAAQSGVLVALLAEAGATAKDDAFESGQGFAMVFNGAGTYDLDAVPADLAQPWALVDPGLAIKLHACCGGTHAPVDAALEIRTQLSDVAAIESVEAAVHPRRFAHLDRPKIGEDPFEAKFSLQYAVALALIFGQVRMEHFRPEILDRPDVVDLVARTRARALRPDEFGPEHFAGVVDVTTKDGRTLHSRWERPRGRTPETALQDSDIEAKFRGCVDGILTDTAADQIVAAVHDLDSAQPVDVLTAPLRRGAGTD